MDPAILAELIKLGPGGLIAALAIAALIAVWKLWRTAETARNEDGRKAAEALHEQKLLNVRSESALALKDFRIEDLQRDLTRCEQEVERQRPRKESPA